MGLAATSGVASAETDAANRAAGPADSVSQAQMKKTKRFKVNLFLFRR